METIEKKNTIFFAGNGGNASTAWHFVNDLLTAYTYEQNGERPFTHKKAKVQSLTESTGIVELFHPSATLWRHSFRLEIGLTKGSILLSGILSSTKSYGNETSKLTKANPDKIGEPEETTNSFLEDTSWSEETLLFINNVKNGKEIESGNYEEARNTLVLVYQIYSSDQAWSKTHEIQRDS